MIWKGYTISAPNTDLSARLIVLATSFTETPDELGRLVFAYRDVQRPDTEK